MPPSQVRQLAAAFVVLALLAPRIHIAEEPAAKAQQYESPEAVFQAAKEATKKKDYAAFCQLLTPESQTAMAGVLAMTGQTAKVLGAIASEFQDPKHSSPEFREQAKKLNQHTQ
jgi:hypothetical protein